MRSTLSRRLLGVLGVASAILMLLAAMSACSTTAGTPTPTNDTIKVSMLIQSSPTDAKWFRDVEVPKGTDAYELTEKVADGNLKSQYAAAYRSHFLDSLLGVDSKDPNYWLIYVWSEPESKWESLPVGADLYSLKDGHVLAWYYADTSKQQDAPSATP